MRKLIVTTMGIASIGLLATIFASTKDALSELLTTFKKGSLIDYSKPCSYPGTGKLREIFQTMQMLEPDKQQKTFALIENGYFQYDPLMLDFGSMLAYTLFQKQVKLHYAKKLLAQWEEHVKDLVTQEEKVLENIKLSLNEVQQVVTATHQRNTTRNNWAATTIWTSVLMIVLAKTGLSAPIGIGYSSFRAMHN